MDADDADGPPREGKGSSDEKPGWDDDSDDDELDEDDPELDDFELILAELTFFRPRLFLGFLRRFAPLPCSCATS